MYSGNDRVQQVNAITQLAADLAMDDSGSTAEEIVEFALDISDDGIELPEWFDAHDRALLLREVEHNIS